LRKKAALISLRFNPAFIQHLVAYAKALHELNIETEFLLDDAYGKFTELAGLTAIAANSNIVQSSSPTHAVFFNVSIENADLATKLQHTGTKILYLYHEPRKVTLNYLKSDGLRGLLVGAAAHRVSVPLLRVADKVVMGSQYALSVYRQGDARHNAKACTFPLIYDDEAGLITPETVDSKRYFSYVGNIGHVHALDQYVDVMRESFKRNSDLKFLVASRMPLPGYFLKDRMIRSNLGKIKVLCGQTLQNSEINDCYAKSFCVWNLYRRSTQSAVMPKAFMFGTPVIASKIGSFPEFVIDGYNGRYANAGDPGNVLSIASELRARIAEYAGNCRSSFLGTFFYRSRLDELRQLLA